MVTATTQPATEKSADNRTERDTKDSPKVPEIKVSDADIKESVKHQIINESVPVKTSEDAAQAYLRGLIEEDTLRQVVGRHGQVSENWISQDQKNAYGKELPDDVIWDKPDPKKSNEEQVKRIEEKNQERKEAMEDSLKHSEDPLEKKALEADLERYYNPKKTEDKK